MIRNFSKDTFVRVLCDRPSNIRNLQRPDDAFISRCLDANPKVFDYVDKSWLTLEVLQHLLTRLAMMQHPHLKALAEFTLEVREAVPQDKLGQFLNKHLSCANYFPQVDYKTYLKYIVKMFNDNFEEIREDYRTEELLVAYFSDPGRYSVTLPDEIYTDSIVDRSLAICPNKFNYIPERFQTRERFAYVLVPSVGFDLVQDIPFEAWDASNALKAAQCSASNIRHIPKEFLTKEICLETVSKNCRQISYIPMDLIDEDVLLAAFIAGDMSGYGDHVTRKFLTEKFLFRLVAEDAKNASRGIYGLHNYLYFAGNPDEKTWIKIIKMYPKAITSIEKSLQTQDILNAFFESAGLDLIDSQVTKLNLGKIKKEHVPFLIGTGSALLQGIIQRKMAPAQRVSKKEEVIKAEKDAQELLQGFQSESVCVDLTDAEFLDLIEKYKK